MKFKTIVKGNMTTLRPEHWYETADFKKALGMAGLLIIFGGALYLFI